MTGSLFPRSERTSPGTAHTRYGQCVRPMASPPGTGLFVMHGTSGKDGTTITLKGEHPGPYKRTMKHRAVWKTLDSNTQTFTMYHIGKKRQRDERHGDPLRAEAVEQRKEYGVLEILSKRKEKYGQEDDCQKHDLPVV